MIFTIQFIVIINFKVKHYLLFKLIMYFRLGSLSDFKLIDINLTIKFIIKMAFSHKGNLIAMDIVDKRANRFSKNKQKV
jgi:hypothetical protein